MGIEKDLEHVKYAIQELVEELMASSQYQDYIRCERILEADQGARQLLEQFNRYQSNPVMDRQSIERAQRIEGVIRENQAIQNYIAARKELTGICQEAESVINQILQFDFGSACAPRSNCC